MICGTGSALVVVHGGPECSVGASGSSKWGARALARDGGSGPAEA